jgi:hypothetical protein
VIAADRRQRRKGGCAGALVLIAKSEGWQSLGLDTLGAEAETLQAVRPMIRQVRAAVPILQKKAEAAEHAYRPTCGNCIQHIEDRRQPGVWRGRAR